MTKLKSVTLQYQYPSFIRKFPALLKWVYDLNYLTQLRKWYVMREWKSVLSSMPSPFTVVDFGCGEGQYIVPLTQQFASSTFIGADYHQPSVELMDLFSIPNLSGRILNLESDQLKEEADLALCIGVLQYIDNDQLALDNMFKSLRKNGQLLLYVPINGQFLTTIYKSIFERFEQYESVNNRKRVYTEKEIIAKCENSGFIITQKVYTYGTAGKLSHELLNSCITLIVSGNYLLKIIAGICLVLFYPLVLLLMMVDYFSNKSDGNGLLLILEKTKIIY